MIDTITAEPLKEVNGVKFGMKREEVRKLFGEAKEFRKSKFSKNTTDDFGFCHVYYNTENQCEAVEIFDTKVMVNGVLLFPTSLKNAKELLNGLAEHNDSFINIEKAVGIYAPSGQMESILFGAEGYYDFLTK